MVDSHSNHLLLDRESDPMPDGTRKRRFSPQKAKRQWYASHRAKRFRRRFGLLKAAA